MKKISSLFLLATFMPVTAILLVGCDKKPDVKTIDSVLPKEADKTKVLFTGLDGQKLIYSKANKTTDVANYDFVYYIKSSGDSISDYLKDITLAGCQKNWSEKCDSIQLATSISEKSNFDAVSKLVGVTVNSYKYYPVNITTLEGAQTYNSTHISCKNNQCEESTTTYTTISDQIINSMSVNMKFDLNEDDDKPSINNQFIGYANGDYGSLVKYNKECEPNQSQYIKFESSEYPPVETNWVVRDKSLSLLKNGNEVTLCEAASWITYYHGPAGTSGLNPNPYSPYPDGPKENIAIVLKNLGNNIWGFKKGKCQISINMQNPDGLSMAVESGCNYYYDDESRGENILSGEDENNINGIYKKSLPHN